MNRHARAPLPVVTVALTAAILGVFAVELRGEGMGLCQRFGFVPEHPSLGTAFSSLFLHDASNLWHVGGNVLALAFFGALVERSIGHVRFVVLFTLGGVGAAAFHMLANPGSLVPEVGASGSIFAVMAAAAMLYPRLLGFVAAFAALNIWHTVTGTGGDVATAAHIGGFVTGFVLTLVVFRRQLAAARGWRPARRGVRAASRWCSLADELEGPRARS